MLKTQKVPPIKLTNMRKSIELKHHSTDKDDSFADFKKTTSISPPPTGAKIEQDLKDDPEILVEPMDSRLSNQRVKSAESKPRNESNLSIPSSPHSASQRSGATKITYQKLRQTQENSGRSTSLVKDPLKPERLTLKLKSKDFIDPCCFSVTKPSISRKQIINLKFMHHLINDLGLPATTMKHGKTTNFNSMNLSGIETASLQSSQRAGGKNGDQVGKKLKTRHNPLYGYKIVSVKASKPGTVVYRLR